MRDCLFCVRCRFLRTVLQGTAWPWSRALCCLLQSVASTSGRRQRRAQPVAELAADAEDIKSRLANVPVYTVANKKNEFVLVSGEVCPTGNQASDPKLLDCSTSARAT